MGDGLISMLKKIGLILGLCVVAGASLLSVNQYFEFRWESGQLESSTELVIEHGTSTNQLLTELARLELIPDSRWYRKWRTETGVQSPKAGEYVLSEGMSARDIWDRFSRGEVKQYAVTLVEGTNVYDVLAQLRQYEFLQFDLSSTTPAELADELQLSISSAEGQFSADTFYVNRETTASD